MVQDRKDDKHVPPSRGWGGYYTNNIKSLTTDTLSLEMFKRAFLTTHFFEKDKSEKGQFIEG